MPRKQTAKKTTRSRTYARNRAAAVVLPKAAPLEGDGLYFLKLIIVILLGTLWIKLNQPLVWAGMPFGAIPLGAIIGLIGISLWEKNPYDRRIWYAVLIVVTIICYFVPAGIVI